MRDTEAKSITPRQTVRIEIAPIWTLIVMETYRHSQIGYIPLLFSLSFVLAILYAFLFGDMSTMNQYLFGIMGIVYALLAIIMYKLTIRVDDEHVSWSLGLGTFRNKVKLDTIRDVKVVDDTNAMGYGMYWTKKGTVYNISGSRGVELYIKTPWKKDKVIILGSDEPEELKEALLKQLNHKQQLWQGESKESLQDQFSLEKDPQKQSR